MQEVVSKLGHGNIPTMCALPVLGRFSKNSALGLRSLSWRRASTVLQTQQLVQLQEKIKALNHKGTTGTCRAGLEDDAPFAVAIAASVLSTLVLPFEGETDEEANKGVSPLGGDDVRYAAMGIISFIPLFNWLVWVFAWLDTRKQRYLIYAIVYLAPYLRSGLSVSPEDSWLPLASVLACIIHVQVALWRIQLDDVTRQHELLCNAFTCFSKYLVENQSKKLKKLDISASSEGDQNMNISKVLFTGTQVKQMRERADTLLLRLQRLADKPAGAMDSEGEKLPTAEDISRVEMEQWDKKLARSKAKDDARDTQS